MKSNDPRSPDSPSATPAPVTDEDDGGGQRAPFSISDGDFSTPHRRKRTITRPRGLRALEVPAASVTDPSSTDAEGADAATPPPDLASGPARPVEMDPALSESAPPMSAVDEFLASPPTPVPEAPTPAPGGTAADLSPSHSRSRDQRGEFEATSARAHPAESLSASVVADSSSGDDDAPARAEGSFVTSDLGAAVTPAPEIPIDGPREPSTASVGPVLASVHGGTPTPAPTRSSGLTPAPVARSHRRPTPPPIPPEAMSLAHGSEDGVDQHKLSPPHDVPELPGEAYVETSTFAGDDSSGSGAALAARDGMASSGSLPIIENASAGAEMRLAALGGDSQIDAVIDSALPVDRQTRDEAMVDELLRRATEQVLGDATPGQPNDHDVKDLDIHEVHEVEDLTDATPGPAAAPSIQIEPSIGVAGPAEPGDTIEPVETIEAIETLELPAEAPPATERVPEIAETTEADLEAIEVDEPTAGPRAHPAAEPSLSPLAQTLAHMAEALHVDFGNDQTVDIDIVDGPLVSAPRRATPTGGAVPPPVPGAALTASAAAGAAAVEAVPADSSLPEALADRPRLPRRSKPWYEEVFDEDYLRTLPFMTAEQTLREVDFIESSLAAPKGGQILDVGCGYGRHAIELVQRGLTVTGLDLSLPLLIRAADEAQRRALSVNFVHNDMRALAFDREFDGAYCMLTSFGYFDEESNFKVAEGIARALKPGGRFLLDVVNRDYIVGDLPARIWWEGDGCVVLEEVEFNFNTSRILTHRSVVFEDGRQLDQEISVRAYSLHELGKLFRQAGFRVIDVAGSIYTPGRFFGAASRNLIILAERKRD